jgi:DNA-directed RNA polymerase subunit RPC12/RpoP
VTTLAVAPELLDPADGEPTLDEELVDLWEGLAADRVVQCPVCRDAMTPERGADAAAIGGRCRGCGSRFY